MCLRINKVSTNGDLSSFVVEDESSVGAGEFVNVLGIQFFFLKKNIYIFKYMLSR